MFILENNILIDRLPTIIQNEILALRKFYQVTRICVEIAYEESYMWINFILSGRKLCLRNICRTERKMSYVTVVKHVWNGNGLRKKVRSEISIWKN